MIAHNCNVDKTPERSPTFLFQRVVVIIPMIVIAIHTYTETHKTNNMQKANKRRWTWGQNTSKGNKQTQTKLNIKNNINNLREKK